MPKLKNIIEQNDTRAGRAFDIVVQGLIVISLLTFSFETLPDLSPTAVWWLRFIEVVTVCIFTIEYIIRIAVADRKARFVFSFYGMIDLLSILPFYIASGVDLRAIRIIRLFRIVRILKLARYSKAMQRFHKALILAREELVLYVFATLVLLYLSSVGIYFFERDAQPEAFASVFHSLWWAIVTLTTVGYGDIYPITVGGRVFTFFALLVALGVVSVPAGIVSSALSKARELEKITPSD